MKKIEIIWRELLYQSIEKKNNLFRQKDIAHAFGFSTSTVFQALIVPRKMGAVRVTGRNFVVEDSEKLLYHWANDRSLLKDTVFTTRVELPVFEIEGRMPPNVVFAGFSAARRLLKDTPSDYDKVYVYSESVEKIKERFVQGKGRENLIVLRADKFLFNYGQITTFAQTFVDLWNMSEWYAKEYVNALRKILL